MPATEPIFDVNIKSLPAGGEDVTIVGPLDGSGNVKVSVQSAPGSQTVTGPNASGTPSTGDPVLVAGLDGTDVRTLDTDTAGRLNVNVSNIPAVTLSGTQTVDIGGVPQVQGSVAAGSPVANNPVQVGGTDGTDVRELLTDSSGRLAVNVNTLPTATVTGAGANGAAVSGNPVLTAGSDGTDTRTLATDATGKLNVNVSNTPSVTATGAGANGAAVSGNPVLAAGSDGTDARTLATDATGKLNVNVSNTPTVTVGTITPPTTPVSGQTTIVTGGTAVQLPSHVLAAGIIAIYALPGNAGTVYIGPSTVTSATGIPLTKSQPLMAYLSNTNALYVNGPTAGDGIGFLAS